MELTKPVERSLWRNKCFGLVEQLNSAKFGCLSREQVDSYIPYVFAITPSKSYMVVEISVFKIMHGGYNSVIKNMNPEWKTIKLHDVFREGEAAPAKEMEITDFG